MRRAQVAAGFDMVVLGDNDIVSASIYHHHYWEMRKPSAMASKADAVLPRSGTFLDIGANLGYYSLLFAKAGYDVVAVEAMTRNRKAIEGSLCLNPELRSRVKIVPVALVSPEELSSTTCVIKSTSRKINIGNGALSCGSGQTCEAGDANCEVVPVKTLDMVLSEVSPKSVDVVKMDVEVHECQVLAGGGSLFTDYRPQILHIETAFGDSGKCVEAKASAHGYRTKTVQGDTVMVASDTGSSAGGSADGVAAAEILRTNCVPTGMRKARVSAGFDMVVLGDNDIVSSSIYHQRFWEIKQPSSIASKAGAVLPASGTFLDIGANLGYYSLLFAKAGFDVVAVEAMTRNRKAIEGSLCLNPELRSRVKIVPVALVSPEELSSTTCVIKSTSRKINIGNGALSCGSGQTCEAGDANCEVVPVKTLDMVLSEVSPKSVDVVKMDVEVHECQVLAGGGSLFTDYRPQILHIETAFGDSGKCVEAKASAHGYRTKTVQGDTVMVASDTGSSAGGTADGLAPAETLPANCVPDGMRKAHVSAGFDMVVLGDNDIVSSSIYHQHFWEMRTPSGMASKAGAVLPATGTFLDIGANLGYYSLLFAKAGYDVVAVEAMTRNRKAIEGSLCLNPELRSRVKIVPVALVSPEELSSTTCVIKSTSRKINIGNGALSCGSGQTCEAGDANCEVVPVKTLDMVLSEVSPRSVDVVKMDVEVHECQVLAGGGSLFTDYRPQILHIETAFGDSGKCVEAKASAHGYRTKTVQGDTVMVASDTGSSAGGTADGLAPAETLPANCVPDGMRKAHVSAGFDMVVLGDNDIVSSSIYHQHYWEMRTPSGMASKAGAVLPATGTFLDIGANLGYYSLLFAKAGYDVVAVEAMTRNRKAIEGSLCLNPELRSRVKIVPVALVSPEELSSTTCVIKSTSRKINIGNGALSCGSGQTCEAGDANCEVVPVKTLDMVLSEVSPKSVDVVKMDVEVHECQVLAGGGSLFTDYRPQILHIETAFGDSGKCVEAKASAHGYRTKTVQGDTVMVASDTGSSAGGTADGLAPAETLPANCVPDGMRKAHVSAGFDMVVLGDNDIVSSSIYHQHYWEMRTPSGMASKAGAVLPATGTFLDIGANLGYYSLLFAKAGFDVVAVEAMTRNRKAIEGSLCLNPELRSRVKIVPVALVSPEELSSTTCVIKSTSRKINIGNGALSCGSGQTCEAGDANCEVVPVKTLDMVLSEVSPRSVDVVKMDVEVHECQVLAGGGSLFTDYRPQILHIETAFGDSGKCVEAKASAHGYRTKTVQGDTVMVASTTGSSRGGPADGHAPAKTLPANCVPDGMRKAHVSAGFDMVVLGDNDIVSSSIYHQHYWEMRKPSAMASKADAVLPASGTFLDIGANLGYYSLLFAKAGFDVVAVEAMTRNRKAIEGSLCLNPELRSRVKIVPVALVSPEELSSTTCVIKSTSRKINIGNGALSCGSGQTCEAGDANCEVVPVKTLDMVLSEVSPRSVDVVKMDVEVHECQVLAGGGSLFTDYRPQILHIETAFGDSGKCVEAKASAHGYRTKTVQGDTVMVAPGF